MVANQTQCDIAKRWSKKFSDKLCEVALDTSLDQTLRIACENAIRSQIMDLDYSVEIYEKSLLESKYNDGS